LLVGFYLLVGLAQLHLRQTLTARRVFEYVGMSLIAVLLIFMFPG